MITFMLERFSDVYEEALPLLHEHYKEISTHINHGIKLNAQIDVYKQRERDGTLLVLVGREEGKIIAYTACFVAPALHYKDCLTCLPDIFYVRPDRRNGSVGVRMFRALEFELKKRGVKRWAVGCKTDHDASRLFHYLGFKPVELTFEKWL